MGVGVKAARLGSGRPATDSEPHAIQTEPPDYYNQAQQTPFKRYSRGENV